MSPSRCGAIAAIALAVFAAVTPVAAAPNCDSGAKKGNSQCDSGLNLSATPELDSAVLFGTGLLGAMGYAALRFRARRRQD